MENGKRKAEDEAESAPAAQRSRVGPKYPKTMVQKYRTMIRAFVFCVEQNPKLCFVPDVLKIVINKLRACYGGVDLDNIAKVSAPIGGYLLRQSETLMKIGTTVRSRTATDTVVSDFLTGRELCRVPTESMSQVVQCAFTPTNGYILFDIGHQAHAVYDMEVLNATDLRYMHLSRVARLAEAPCSDCALFNHGESVFFISLYRGKIEIVDLRTSKKVTKFHFSGKNVRVHRVNSLDPNLIVSEFNSYGRSAADAVRFSIDADGTFKLVSRCDQLGSLPQDHFFVSFFDQTFVYLFEQRVANPSVQVVACKISFDQEQIVFVDYGATYGEKSIHLVKDKADGRMKPILFGSRVAVWDSPSITTLIVLGGHVPNSSRIKKLRFVWDGEKIVVTKQ